MAELEAILRRRFQSPLLRGQLYFIFNFFPVFLPPKNWTIALSVPVSAVPFHVCGGYRVLVYLFPPPILQIAMFLESSRLSVTRIDGLHLTSWQACWRYNTKKYVINFIACCRRWWLTLSAISREIDCKPKIIKQFSKNAVVLKLGKNTIRV